MKKPKTREDMLNKYYESCRTYRAAKNESEKLAVELFKLGTTYSQLRAIEEIAKTHADSPQPIAN